MSHDKNGSSQLGLQARHMSNLPETAMAETRRISQEVRLFITARRQARFWEAQGFDQLAARLRLTARYCIRHARWVKKAEGAPHDAPAPAENPQPA